MADTLTASLDIDTGFASSNVKRFTPRAFATAERVWVKAGERIFRVATSHPPYGSPDYGITLKTKNP